MAITSTPLRRKNRATWHLGILASWQQLEIFNASEFLLQMVKSGDLVYLGHRRLLVALLI